MPVLHDTANNKMTAVLEKMRPLIHAEFNIEVAADDGHSLASFALYGLKSAHHELQHLAQVLIGLQPELAIVRTLTQTVDRVKTGFASDAPIFVAMRR